MKDYEISASCVSFFTDETISLLCPAPKCPSSYPVVVHLSRMAALYHVPESGNRCRGFHPLESIRGADLRWKMDAQRQSRGELGVWILPSLPCLPLSPPSLLPGLFTGIASLCVSTHIARAEGGQTEAVIDSGSQSWIQMSASDATTTTRPSLIRSCCWKTASRWEIPVPAIAKAIWQTNKYQICFAVTWREMLPCNLAHPTATYTQNHQMVGWRRKLQPGWHR